MTNWRKMKNYRWDSSDGWRSNERWRNREKPQHFWWKRTVAAMLIFAIVYLAHVSDTGLGREVDYQVKNIVTESTDFQEIANNFLKYMDDTLDLTAIRKVTSKMITISPAQPLNYMSMPVTGTVVSSFGEYVSTTANNKSILQGILIKTKPEEPVKAAAAGKVKTVTVGKDNSSIVIDNGLGTETYYGRLSKVVVKKEEVISQNQIIGFVANNQQQGALLYFEIRDKGVPIDPAARLKGIEAVVEGK